MNNYITLKILYCKKGEQNLYFLKNVWKKEKVLFGGDDIDGAAEYIIELKDRYFLKKWNIELDKNNKLKNEIIKKMEELQNEL